ncbi:MAG: hypothetical protein RLZ33_2698, partial [Bacteroidota bacterium]
FLANLKPQLIHINKMLRVTVTRSINVIFALLTCQLFLGLVTVIPFELGTNYFVQIVWTR